MRRLNLQINYAQRSTFHDDNDVTFREPWEAQVLALVNSLIANGKLTAQEWAEILGQEIRNAQEAGDPDDGSTYYMHVLAAIERLSAEKEFIDAIELTARKNAWVEAYKCTPHGQVVTLNTTDY